MKGLREPNHSGVLRHKDTCMAEQFLPASAEVGVTAIVWGQGTMGRGSIVYMSVYGLCSNTPHAIQSFWPSTGVTFQEISTDVGLGPQLSRQSSRDGWGEMSRREGETEKRWMLLIRLGKISQLYGLWRRTLISSLSSFLPLSLCVIAFSDRANDSPSVVLAALDLSRKMALVLFSELPKMR